MINGIVFDLSEVILTGILGVEIKIAMILKRENDDIYTQFYNADFQDLLVGKVTEEQYWKRQKERNNWTISIDNLKYIARQNFKQIADTSAILKKLSVNSSLKRGLISDHVYEWIKYCKAKFDYETNFHEKIYSFEVGLTKQQPEIYQLMLDKFSLSASECLFIDDNIKNISVAKRLGFQTIQFKSAGQLINELRRYKLETG